MSSNCVLFERLLSSYRRSDILFTDKCNLLAINLFRSMCLSNWNIGKGSFLLVLLWIHDEWNVDLDLQQYEYSMSLLLEDVKKTWHFPRNPQTITVWTHQNWYPTYISEIVYLLSIKHLAMNFVFLSLLIHLMFTDWIIKKALCG